MLVLRGDKILLKHVGLTVKIHNGREYKELLVEESMVGLKFGEFAFTRKFALNIHEQKNKKKKK